MISKGAGGYEVALRRGQSAEPIGVIAIDHPAPAEVTAIRRRLEKEGVTTDTLVLRLAPGDVVAIRETWPAEIGAYLVNAVEHQLEVKAPWPAGRTAWAHRVVEHKPGPPEQIVVDIWIAGRMQVEEIIAKLSDLGLAPGVVDSGDGYAQPQFNLIGVKDGGLEARRLSLSRTLKRLAALVFLGSAAATVFAMVEVGARRTSEAELVAVLDQAARVSQSHNARYPKLISQILSERARTPSAAIVMEMASRALPDDAYLETLELRDGAITLSGKAGNVPALIGALEASPQFEDVRFAAPTTRSEDDTRETFTISARLSPLLELPARGTP